MTPLGEAGILCLMSNYELTVVLGGKATPAKRKSVDSFVVELVAELKGKIVEKKELGERNLAYEIKKNRSGFFVFFNLELEGLGAKNLTEKLKTKEDIIRYLLIRV